MTNPLLPSWPYPLLLVPLSPLKEATSPVTPPQQLSIVVPAMEEEEEGEEGVVVVQAPRHVTVLLQAMILFSYYLSPKS